MKFLSISVLLWVQFHPNSLWFCVKVMSFTFLTTVIYHKDNIFK